VAGLAGAVTRAPVTPGRAEDIAALIDDETACVVVQSPDVFGLIRDLRPIAEAAHARGALLIAVVTEIVSLGLLQPPGAQGADIVAAEGQSLGNGLNFGGPYVGLFRGARELPAPNAGTADRRNRGRRGAARIRADAFHPRTAYPPRKSDQQHLQPIPALHPGLTIHLSLLGEEGFTRLARLNHAQSLSALADRLAKLPGVEPITPAFFNEFTIRLPKPAAPVVDALAKKGILAGVPGLAALCRMMMPWPTADPSRHRNQHRRGFRRLRHGVAGGVVMAMNSQAAPQAPVPKRFSTPATSPAIVASTTRKS